MKDNGKFIIMENKKFASSDDRGSLHKIVLGENINDFLVKEVVISKTISQYTARGLHLSLSPNDEAKIISCYEGSMLWVHINIENIYHWNVNTTMLTSNDSKVLRTTKGNIHGCISLEDNTSLQIITDENYDDENTVYYEWGSILDKICLMHNIPLNLVNGQHYHDSLKIPENTSIEIIRS